MKVPQSLLGGVALFCGVFIPPSVMEAAVVLSSSSGAPVTDAWDQYNLTADASIPGNTPFPYNSQAFSDNSGPPGQTFTTGAVSCTLDSFSLKGSGTGNGSTGVDGTTLWSIRISLVSGTSLTPIFTQSGLGGVDMGGANGANWLTFNFSGSDILTLNPLATYAVEIYTSNFWWGVAASTTDVYDGGSAFNTSAASRTFNSDTMTPHGYDRTFVAELTAVPEPSSLLLALSGMVWIAVRKKALRRQR